MSIEFAVLDRDGNTVDTVDPYEGHRQISASTYAVENGYYTYEVTIPDGGSYIIRQMETTK